MTLIETVAVLACLGILIPLVIAATGSAARPNRERMCAYRLGKLGSAMLLYTIENEGNLPGSPGTSGAPLILDYGDAAPDEVDIPIPLTQVWDWAAPLAGYLGVALDANRATRVEQFRVGKFWCPSNNIPSDPFDPSSGTIGGSPGPWQRIRMLSYNLIRNFLMYENNAPLDPALGNVARWITVGGGMEIPYGYVPRIDRLGTVQDKVFLADSSRWAASTGSVTHNIGPFTGAGGMYADGGPTIPESYMHSFLFELPTKAFSYRHVHNEDFGLNAAHYDGHVSWMSESTTRHPRWWFPTGTTIPWNEMNHPTRVPLIDEILQDPNFEYHVP